MAAKIKKKENLSQLKIVAHRKGGEHYTVSMPYQKHGHIISRKFKTEEEIELIKSYKKAVGSEKKKFAIRIRYILRKPQ